LWFSVINYTYFYVTWHFDLSLASLMECLILKDSMASVHLLRVFFNYMQTGYFIRFIKIPSKLEPSYRSNISLIYCLSIMKTICSYLAKNTRNLKYTSKDTKYPQKVWQTKNALKKVSICYSKNYFKIWILDLEKSLTVFLILSHLSSNSRKRLSPKKSLKLF